MPCGKPSPVHTKLYRKLDQSLRGWKFVAGKVVPGMSLGHSRCLAQVFLALGWARTDLCMVKGSGKPGGKKFLRVHAPSLTVGRGTISRLTTRTIGSMLGGMNTNSNPITEAIDAAGSGPKLAKRLGGISARAIYKWRARWDAGIVSAVPSTRVKALSEATGIPNHRFRPDLWTPAQGAVTAHDRRAGDQPESQERAA